MREVFNVISAIFSMIGGYLKLLLHINLKRLLPH